MSCLQGLFVSQTRRVTDTDSDPAFDNRQAPKTGSSRLKGALPTVHVLIPASSAAKKSLFCQADDYNNSTQRCKIKRQH